MILFLNPKFANLIRVNIYSVALKLQISKLQKLNFKKSFDFYIINSAENAQYWLRQYIKDLYLNYTISLSFLSEYSSMDHNSN